MTTKTKPQKPATEIRIGRVKATVWLNDTPNGDRYNSVLTKLYRLPEEKREDKDDSGWRESASFSRDDLPVVEKVAARVFDWCHEQNGSSE